jgi:hypothetical protein
MRIHTLVCILLLTTLKTALTAPANLRGSREVIRVLQGHTYSPSTLNTPPADFLPSADHLEDTIARKLVTRRPRWTPRLAPILEEENAHMTGAIPSRYSRKKKNVLSSSRYSNVYKTAAVSQLQSTRLPIQSPKGLVNWKNDRRIEFYSQTPIFWYGTG